MRTRIQRFSSKPVQSNTSLHCSWSCSMKPEIARLNREITRHHRLSRRKIILFKNIAKTRSNQLKWPQINQIRIPNLPLILAVAGKNRTFPRNNLATPFLISSRAYDSTPFVLYMHFPQVITQTLISENTTHISHLTELIRRKPFENALQYEVGDILEEKNETFITPNKILSRKKERSFQNHRKRNLISQAHEGSGLRVRDL
ncbi:rRNA-processing protein EFG1 [Striga asiatica]|uniref:rRNA-processing protein EFG1 n=1 Tax=Striga asiatica TaxID=4170 RepID=A0A5A7Q2K5_STRAF|nr:rRNA-processing protein EFG1 [Striga asiatica]